MLLALAGCDRVFGLGDPYEDAAHAGDVIGDVRPNDGRGLDDGPAAPALYAHFAFESTYNDDTNTYQGQDFGNGITFTMGHKLQALTLDGSSCISVPLPDPLMTYTFTFWANPSTLSTNGGKLISRRLNSTSPLHTYEVYESPVASGFGFEQLDSGAETDQIFAGRFVNGAWHHYAVTFDGTTKTWWVDALPIGTQPASIVTYGSNNDVYIGCLDAVTDYFTGSIDELYVYEGALDQAAMAANMAL